MTSSNHPYLLGKEIKMEPVSSTTTMRAGRKRNASQASISSTYSESAEAKKKLKKYQLDPSSDPTVRNAIAAKANREKKKREELQLKHDNEALKEQNALLAKMLEQTMEEKERLAEQVTELKKNNSTDHHQMSPDEYFEQICKDIDTNDLVRLPIKPDDTFNGLNFVQNQEGVENSDEVFCGTLQLEALGLDSDFNLIDTTYSSEISPGSFLDEKAFALTSAEAGEVSPPPAQDNFLPTVPKTPVNPRDLYGEYYNDQMQRSPKILEVLKSMAFTPMDL